MMIRKLFAIAKQHMPAWNEIKVGLCRPLQETVFCPREQQARGIRAGASCF
jgi:hypothetical protein